MLVDNIHKTNTYIRQKVINIFLVSSHFFIVFEISFVLEVKYVSSNFTI